MFVIELADGEEVTGESGQLTINQETGMLSVCRVMLRGNHDPLLAVGMAVGDAPQTRRRRQASLISSGRWTLQYNFTAK